MLELRSGHCAILSCCASAGRLRRCLADCAGDASHAAVDRLRPARLSRERMSLVASLSCFPLLLLLGSLRRRAAARPGACSGEAAGRSSSPPIRWRPRPGWRCCERGGSAVDAAIAVQAMLSLVEPQSSGIGGGAFMNYYDAATKRLTIYDGREVAPAQATPSMFLGPDGKPLPFDTAVLSGRATGVPGVVKMLALAHSEHGKLPWSSLFGSAQRTAAEGFIVSPRLGRLIHGDYAENSAPDVVAYFSKARRQATGPGRRSAHATRPMPNSSAGWRAQGPAALYAGSTAARIVARTRAAPLGGSMTMADLANYQPVKREALCRPYRVYLACVPPPPSSGVGLLQLLMMLERTDIAARGPSDPQAWFLFAEASRIMYADRDRYVGDPAFVAVPVEGPARPRLCRVAARG